ncbi:cytochrome b/b6 domain-containing protein [Candidatus Aalborgicola defluviihabitans]|uniref:cytochrome b/b6 domain-containing protein n=1 Tax=Candidatus Aalborgicola defluviihabitans TaxID=3386187 RepID=UPI0039B907E5
MTIAFILGPEGFGRLMRQGVDPATRSDIVWHESLGLLVLLLTLLRLIWVAFRPAAPQLQMASWMQMMAKLVHLALWTLMFALPATALLALGSEGHALTLLGGIRVDQMPSAAAIFHHFVLKDGVLLSMLPWGAQATLAGKLFVR